MSPAEKSTFAFQAEEGPLSVALLWSSPHEISSADDYHRCFVQYKHILDAMDGISSASAVVSLSAQLIVTTRDVINFLREIRDSPEDLRFTIELLDLLRGNLEQVKRLVEERNVRVDIQPPVASISDALTFCESKIALVEQCVAKFKMVFHHQSSVRKKWASFKHVLKKGEIKRLQDQLGEARRNLQFALDINVDRLGVRNTQILTALLEKVSTMSNDQRILGEKAFMAISHLDNWNTGHSSSTIPDPTEVTHLETGIMLDSTLGNAIKKRATTSHGGNSKHNEKQSSHTKSSHPRSGDNEPRMSSPQSPTHSQLICRKRMLLWYMRTLGYVSILSKSTFIDDAVNIRTVDKRLMSEEQIVVFRPPFLMSQVELRYVNCCGRISRALTVDHVIPFKAAVFDMCRSGDINGLRDAYYAGSVSLEVVDPLGMGLLHYAAGSFQKDLCTWLLRMGVGADRTSRTRNTALTYMGMRSSIDQTSAATKNMTDIARLLIEAQQDLSEFDMSEWFCEYKGPPEGAELILSLDMAKYYVRSQDDSDPLYPALASILQLYAKAPGPWESVLRMLVRSGANVHAKMHRDLEFLDQSKYPCPVGKYGTPLDELFKYTIDPLEGQVAANGWLQILASEGYSILTYLETESDLHARPMQLTIPARRPMGYANERKLVFDWGTRPTVSWDWWINPSSSAFLLRQEFRLMAIQSLSDGMLIKRSWKETWPVILPDWSELHQYCGDAASRSSYKELLDFANARAAKRVEKRRGSHKVPGAWPI